MSLIAPVLIAIAVVLPLCVGIVIFYACRYRRSIRRPESTNVHQPNSRTGRLVTIPLGVLGIIGGIIGILGSLAGLLGCIAAEGTFDRGKLSMTFAVLFAGSVALLVLGGVLLFRK